MSLAKLTTAAVSAVTLLLEGIEKLRGGEPIAVAVRVYRTSAVAKLVDLEMALRDAPRTTGDSEKMRKLLLRHSYRFELLGEGALTPLEIGALREMLSLGALVFSEDKTDTDPPSRLHVVENSQEIV